MPDLKNPKPELSRSGAGLVDCGDASLLEQLRQSTIRA